MENNLKIKIYSDGAIIADMEKSFSTGNVQGFTTNPSLMKKAGIKDYNDFAMEVVSKFPDVPISFEVFADDFELMEKEAEKISSYGKNVYVKIPITNTKGESSIPLIKKLTQKDIKLNVTAILTKKQIEETVDALKDGIKNIVSVFAGRIADTGVDPKDIMEFAVEKCKEKAGTELLWASSRELLNIFQANEIGADIITCTPDLIKKLKMVGMDLEELSLETVKMFNRDIKDLGYTIL